MTVAEIFETMEYGPAPESAQARARLARRPRTARSATSSAARASTAPGARSTASTRPPAGSSRSVTQATAGRRRRRGGGGARGAPRLERALGGHARARYLYALARQVQKHSRLLAVLETLDNGKPIRETRDIDIPLVARHFYHHAGWAQLLETRVRPATAPLGVVGQIIPWNFPLLMLAWKIAPALAAGNTVVLKPAEFTPLTALALRRDLPATPGLPPGVVNIVTGDGETGAALVDHPDVDKIAFTGSTEVGRIIRTATAGTRQEALARARRQVARSSSSTTPISTAWSRAWSTRSGSTRGRSAAPARACWCRRASPSRLIAKLRARMEKLRVGDPLDKAVDIGAIVAPVQLERIARLVRAGRGRGRDAVAAVAGRARRRAASIRRRCFTERRTRRRPSRRSRSSGRCSSR